MAPFSAAHTIRIDVPPGRVHPLIDNLFRWPEWSPWDHADPGLERQFSGAEFGIGAEYAWQGDRRGGAGNLSITESTPFWITIDIHLDRPWRSHSRMRFIVLPGNDQTTTELVWTMTQETTGLSFLSALSLNMEAVIGTLFKESLGRIKEIAEGGTISARQ
ncbi:transcriptional regulator [Enemella evansiae]|uniref:SRPBCC family protein n=1 Tax=Enemella evansiae TaxID=2016499 RepID=UPI000B966043|nr:SRPBCC family protein [Enemella evansiae]OYN99942.1 transcriptional regulator [Enemella evansiae]